MVYAPAEGAPPISTLPLFLLCVRDLHPHWVVWLLLYTHPLHVKLVKTNMVGGAHFVLHTVNARNALYIA